MGCGYGVCMGCVCETKDNNSGHICYKRVCKEGPVFAAEEVDVYKRQPSTGKAPPTWKQ